MSTTAGHIDYYWRFYVTKAGREDLLDLPRYFDDPAELSSRELPANSLFLFSASDRSKIKAPDRWQLLKSIVEPDQFVSFAILRSVS